MDHVTPVGGGVPIKYWLPNLEGPALEQAFNLARLPFAFRHIAIMPDAHKGYGMPIGGVMATKDVIIPNAVGVDIGCGMRAIKTTLTDLSTEQIKCILGGSAEYKGGIRASIPVGCNKHKEMQDYQLMPDLHPTPLTVVTRHYPNARASLGTLGGNNHFIELQKGSDGHIWIMIHSGSRNLGKQVADQYQTLAKKLNAKWHVKVDPNWDLAFLPVDSEEGQEYINEMRYCVDFAKANRFVMALRILEILEWNIGVQILEEYDVAHNYAALEHHFGKNVWVHRKGATRAREGEVGIIPGSQDTASYIVKGKGNRESFKSCSHGAGRRMSRKKARATLNLEEEQAKLDSQGIIHSLRGVKNLDEAPSAYKNIHEVMANQKDLVEVMVTLKTLAVVKG